MNRAAGAKLPPENLVVAGKITTVHGVKGWVKIHSYTAPEENIFDYQPWWVQFPEGWRCIEIDDCRSVAKGFIAHIRGLDDREEARLYCQREIQVSTDQFPPVADGELYWHQLQGLTVLSRFEGKEFNLGKVDGLLETGANDVMVVKPTAESVDDTERLVPYVDQFVVDVLLEQGIVVVDWDPEFEVRKD